MTDIQTMQQAQSTGSLEPLRAAPSVDHADSCSYCNIRTAAAVAACMIETPCRAWALDLLHARKTPEFAAARPGQVLQHLQLTFGLPDEVLGRDPRYSDCCAHQTAACDKDAPAQAKAVCH